MSGRVRNIIVVMIVQLFLVVAALIYKVTRLHQPYLKVVNGILVKVCL